MAYAFNFEDEEQNKQGEGQTQLGPESAIITGQEMKPQEGQSGSGQYTNLQSYLDQPGTREFGEQFTGKIGETVTGAFGAQEKAKSDFQAAAQQGSVAKNENIIKEASETPEMVVADPNKKSEFIAQRDAQYKGPESFTDTSKGVDYYTPAYSATKKAKDYTDSAQNESGQRTLLNELYGRPGYTEGQKTLDSILIGMNPGTRQSLQAQQQKAQEAYTNFGQLEGSLNEFAKQRKSDTEATKNAATSALSSAITQYESQVRSKAEQAIKERDEKVRRINQAIASRDLTGISDQELQSAGLRNNQALYGATAQAVNPNTNLSLDTLTTPEEYQRLLAYQELSPGYVNPITNAGLVGSQVGKSLYNPNEALQQQAIDNAKAYNKLVADTYYAPNSAEHWLPQSAAEARGPGSAYNVYDPQLMQLLQNNMDYYVTPQQKAGVYQQIQDVLNKRKELEAKKDYIKR